VIARNSSFSYKGKPITESEIGRELGVKYVLEGSVRKAADQVRIGVELVDASSKTDEWTAQYDRPLKDIFAVQDEIVGKVVTTLGLLFKLDEMKFPYGRPYSRTENLEAYDDLLRADEYLWRFTKDDNSRARLWIEKSIKEDPKFAEAYAFLAVTYWWDAWNQWSANPQADFARARELSQEALRLDDSNADALKCLSYIDFLQGRFDEAVADAKRAVAGNPNYAAGYATLSDALNASGKAEEALSAAEKAVRLDPAAQDFYLYAVGDAYVELGRYDEGVGLLKRHVAVYPNNLVAHLFIAVADVELGRDEDAHNEAAEVTRISPHFVLASVLATKNFTLHKNWEPDLRKAGLK
jgi:tetratricopeptide (TPR) repeat protein